MAAALGDSPAIASTLSPRVRVQPSCDSRSVWSSEIRQYFLERRPQQHCVDHEFAVSCTVVPQVVDAGGQPWCLAASAPDGLTCDIAQNR
jgi:hypothetical protein